MSGCSARIGLVRLKNGSAQTKNGSALYSGSGSGSCWNLLGSTVSSGRTDMQYTVARKKSISQPKKLPCAALCVVEVKLDRAALRAALRVAEEEARTIGSSRISIRGGRKNQRWLCSWRRRKRGASLCLCVRWKKDLGRASLLMAREEGNWELLRVSVHGGRRNWVVRLCVQWRKPPALCAALRVVEEGTNCFLLSSDLSSLPLSWLSFYTVFFCCSKV